VILTVGHSNLDPAAFLNLLRSGPADLVWDVRSFPVSRFEWFRREQLEECCLRRGRVRGAAPGGRPPAPPPSGATQPPSIPATAQPSPEPFALRDPHAWSERLRRRERHEKRGSS
jgi:hypothetical protein